MAHCFLDTSALVKRHVIETGSRWVKSLVRARAAHTLYVARITAVEVTSAITRRQRAGSLSPAQAGAILGHVRRHLTQRYVIWSASRAAQRSRGPEPPRPVGRPAVPGTAGAGDPRRAGVDQPRLASGGSPAGGPLRPQAPRGAFPSREAIVCLFPK
jgi:hypothetical protein